jgi:serine/threonine-protein kinase
VLLGGIALRGIDADAADSLLAQPKIVAFLAYLALSPAGRFQRRDRLASLLWPELDQAHARTSLRKVVHVVRAALGADAIVSRGDEELVLQTGVLWCDAVECIASADDGRLVQALQLYEGELMPGIRRSRLRRSGFLARRTTCGSSRTRRRGGVGARVSSRD